MTCGHFITRRVTSIYPALPTPRVNAVAVPLPWPGSAVRASTRRSVADTSRPSLELLMSFLDLGIFAQQRIEIARPEYVPSSVDHSL
jgi:hypothetical protein